jgi:tetratricopeptide (TPR) repeat protein
MKKLISLLFSDQYKYIDIIIPVALLILTGISFLLFIFLHWQLFITFALFSGILLTLTSSFFFVKHRKRLLLLTGALGIIAIAGTSFLFIKNNMVMKSNKLSAMGYYYQNTREYNRALDYYNEALEIVKVYGNKRSLYGCLSSIADMYKVNEEYNKALDVYNIILDILAGGGYSFEMILETINTLECSGYSGNRVLEVYNKASGIFKNYMYFDYWKVLAKIGDIYKARGRFDKAMDVFKEELEALDTIEETGEPANWIGSIDNCRGAILAHIRSCYFDQGDYQDALTFYQKALEYGFKDNTLIAEIYKKLKEYEAAIKHFKTALDATLQYAWV